MGVHTDDNNGFTSKQKIKTGLGDYCTHVSMETKFTNTENSSPQIADLKSSNKHVAPQYLYTYYTWKNVRQQCKSNKLKIIAPTW